MIAVYPKLPLALNKPSPKEKPGIMKQHLQGTSFENEAPFNLLSWEYITFELVDDPSV